MKKKILTIAATLIIAILIAGCSQPQAQSVDSPDRTMNVRGTGTVELEPNIARVNIGVRSQSSEVAEALADNTASVEAIIQTLYDLGIEEKDIQTRNFNIYPQQETRPMPELEEEQPSQTFVVENTIAVVVRDLDSLGEVLAASVSEGANTIHGVTFDIEDREAAYEEARKLAIEDAQTQAEAIAEAAGVTLGAIQSINIDSNGGPTPRAAVEMEQAAAADVPIASGTLTIRVRANLTYQIE